MKNYKKSADVFKLVIATYKAYLCDMAYSNKKAVEIIMDFTKKAKDDEYLLKVLSDSEPGTESKKYEFIKRISAVLLMMPKDLREIVVKDFLDNEIKVKWWVSKYSRSTYYRKREEAICQFVSLFNIKNNEDYFENL